VAKGLLLFNKDMEAPTPTKFSKVAIIMTIAMDRCISQPFMKLIWLSLIQIILIISLIMITHLDKDSSPMEDSSKLEESIIEWVLFTFIFLCCAIEKIY